jgi:hypothetical protein
MTEKLRLALDELRVDTFVAQEAPAGRGTVHANEVEATAGATCRTFCYTLACCPNTALC